MFCRFRVVCAVIFNYYYYHEFLFFGWHARLFLITTTITSFVFFPGGVSGYFFLIITTIASFVFSGDVRGYFSINHYRCEFCFSIGVRGYFQLLLLFRLLCFRVACAVIFSY